MDIQEKDRLASMIGNLYVLGGLLLGIIIHYAFPESVKALWAISVLVLSGKALYWGFRLWLEEIRE